MRSLFKSSKRFPLLVLVAISTVQHASSRAIQVEQGGGVSLVQALKDDTVSTIVLGSNYTIADEQQGALQAPIELKRNVTIQGTPGDNPPTTLDLAFRRSGVVLCADCQVTLRNLTLKNARRGTGASVDFFAGDDAVEKPLSAVLLRDVYRLRVACTPGTDTTEVLASTKRSTVLPPSSTGKQVFELRNLTFQGVDYSNAIHLIDFTQDLPLTHQEGRAHASAAHFGGYALGSQNVLYLCEHEVSEACLVEKAPDTCVNELIDSVLTAKKQGGGSGGLGGPIIAAIVVPIVGLLVAALFGCLIVSRRRKQQRLEQQQQQQDKLQEQDGGAPYVVVRPDDKDGPAGGLGSGDDSAMEVHSKSCGGRTSLEIARQPMGGKTGWQLISSRTADFIEAPPEAEATVEFGHILGAGSFGRVYRARWAGRDVACKVIEHDRSTLAAVEAEAALMLTVNHPNVVKAYHYCTFSLADTGQSERGSRGSKSFSLTGQPSGVYGSGRSGDSAGSSGGRGVHELVPDPVRGPLRQKSAGGKSLLAAGAPGSTSGSSNGASSGVPVAVLQHGGRQTSLGNDSACDTVASEGTAGDGSAATGGSIGGRSKKSLDDCGTDTTPTMGAGGQAVKHKAETWLIQEFCDVGTLGSVSSSWDKDDECDEQMLERLLLLQDTAMGLRALHDSHVVHGDLNARNVLVSSCSTSEIGMSAKVADLGLARCLAHHATHRTTNSCGTMSHMAPELLRWGRMSAAVDVYAFGIMMWEMYNQGQAAFDKLHYGQFFETVVLRSLRPALPPGMPRDYELLMRQCWAGEPTERPSVPLLLECLEIMIADRQQRVHAARSSLQHDATTAENTAAAAAAAAAAASSGPSSFQSLLALLRPGQEGIERSPLSSPRVHHPTTPGNAADGPTAASPSNPSSNVSLSALFVDRGQAPSPKPGQLPQNPSQQQQQQPSSSKSVWGQGPAAAAAAAVAGLLQRVSPGNTPPHSTVGDARDVESQLDGEQTINSSSWFV